MLRLNNSPIKVGELSRIILQESWHEKLVTFGKIQNCPYEYHLVDIVKKDKEKYFICESEKNKKVRLALSEFIVRYLFSKEVPDSNIGLSFKEHLPLEGSQILITSVRNPNEIIPAKLEVDVSLVELDEQSLLSLDFKLNWINGKGFSSIQYFSEGPKISTWKFLLNEDESYMTDYEKTFKDAIIHKMYVRKSTEKLATYLENEGAIEHAKALRQRGLVHDNSKIQCEDELYALSRIINDQSSMTDANQQLSAFKKDAIALHHKHNTHHPEHFKSVTDMSRLDIMEMCCDWHARSLQKGTNFLEFIETRLLTRFHFPDYMLPEIWHYCHVLAAA